MENPADAGMERLEFVQQVAENLNLTAVHVNYCAKSNAYPWKKTVLYTNSKSIIELYNKGQMLCKHPPTFKHVECSKNPVEAASYKPLWAAEWADLLVQDAKKARADSAFQHAPPEKRQKVGFDEGVAVVKLEE